MFFFVFLVELKQARLHRALSRSSSLPHLFIHSVLLEKTENNTTGLRAFLLSYALLSSTSIVCAEASWQSSAGRAYLHHGLTDETQKPRTTRPMQSSCKTVVDTPCFVQGLYTAGTASTSLLIAVFRPLVVFVLLVRVLSSTVIPSKYRVSFEYELYFDCLGTVSTIIRPILGHKTHPDSLTSGSCCKLLSLETTRVLRGRAVFRGIYTAGNRYFTANTLSIWKFCSANIACTPSISCFDAAGTKLPVLSGFGPARITLHIFQPSLKLQYFGRQYSNTPVVLGLRLVLEYLFAKP